ncbi:hypothetical protein Dfer_2409 [Dyadobacter fermentans DSM 18053]|uniref:Secretion system C-terminal sorting domain-containing protein n=2 Tax=Dyadobacter fermentans TaxID=94254 RepID=C6W0M1_DYAFD|nr:hypothetical protein Dfer_2409 [Dyadobacter fermentans DSM 18053]
MWFSVIALTVLLMPQLVRAQNAGINIQPAQPSIMEGAQGFLDVTICAQDVVADAVPAGVLRPLISFPDNLTILEVTNLDGSAPTAELEIQKLENDPVQGHNVRVLYLPQLPNFTCYTFRIRVQGNAIGTGLITANLAYTTPLSNNPNDDNSTTTIPVVVNLPVKLTKFEAVKQEGNASLTWATSEETNSDRFEVQRSADGKAWATIETVQSAGESTTIRTYEAVDRSPMNGENLYRLKMIDNDGSTAFSSVKGLRFEIASAMVYPNPVVDFLHLSDKNWEKVSEVSIHDNTGRRMYFSGNEPESKIDVRPFTPGIYTVRIKNADGSENRYSVAVVR